MRTRSAKVSSKKAPAPGLFLAFEGGEGSGKSTQVRRLVERLQAKGFTVLATREPGGSAVGKRIRELVLDAKLERLSPRAELLLYEADRAEHIDEVIGPAVAQGKIVVCDRHADSSTVYQGMCRGLGVKATQWLNRYATGGMRPDLVILLDIPETEGLARARGRNENGALDRLEREDIDFHRQVRRGFLKLARQNPSRFFVLDARKPEQSLSDAIFQKVELKLKRRRLWK